MGVRETPKCACRRRWFVTATALVAALLLAAPATARLPDSANSGIISGPDGNLWAAFLYQHALYRISVSGQITPLSTGTTEGPLAAGADGNLWAEVETKGVVRMSPPGQETFFAPPPGVAYDEPGEMAAAPDGNVWFTNGSAIGSPEQSRVSRITPSGQVTEFPIPLSLVPGATHQFELAPREIAVGGGVLWLLSERGLLRVTPAGQMSFLPVPQTGGRHEGLAYGGGALVNWLQQHTILPATIPADIYALKNGNPRPVAILFAFLQRAEPLSRGMHFSVLCSEWVPYERESAIVRAGRRAFPSYPTSVLKVAPALPFLSSACRAWKVSKAPTSVRKRTISSIPTLAIGGGFDAVTGTQWARYAVAKFRHGTYIDIPGVSHFVALDSTCAQQVMLSFIDHPTAPSTSCVRTLEPAPFSLKPTSAPPGQEPPADDGAL
jgi:pimeloyl-ACP methyl ester carboxylesterase